MEDNKVNVKLEKHLWPDEIKNQRQKQSTRYLMIFLVLVAFVLGILTRSVLGPKEVVNRPIVTAPQDPENPDSPPQQEIVLTPEEQFEKFRYIYSVLSNNWYFSKNMDDVSTQIMDNAINGMIEKNGDIHTAYMTADELKAFEEGINQNYVGIGVQYYQVDGYSIVLKVFNNSPAEKAGVKPGDIFMTVDGTNVVDMDQDAVSNMVRGEEGTVVVIEFQRGEDIIEIPITRGAITSTTFAEMLEDNIGYLEINSFGMSTADEIEKELEMLRDNGATKLIIDVRDNGGGYLYALNKIAAFFLEPNAIIIQQEDVTGNIVKTYASGKRFDNFKDIVMLINQNSASASEVLTLALRDNLNIELVGTTTYGKGTVQTTIPMNDGSNLKYTIAEWISPSGQKINGKGIAPTVEVKLHDIFYQATPSLAEDEVIKVDQVHTGLVFVQQALDYLGFDPGRFDGYFSQQTLEAYHDYQESRGFDLSDEITRENITQLSSRVYQVYNENLSVTDIQLEKAIEIIK